MTVFDKLKWYFGLGKCESCSLGHGRHDVNCNARPEKRKRRPAKLRHKAQMSKLSKRINR